MSLNPEYTNNPNIISIGIQHNVTLYTDRPITPGAGDARTKVNQTMQPVPKWDDGDEFSSPPGSGSFEDRF